MNVSTRASASVAATVSPCASSAGGTPARPIQFHSGTAKAGAKPFNPITDDRIAQASESVAARKTTNAMATKRAVARIASGRGNGRPTFFQKCSTTNATPCMAPHTTKVQAAPCQKPPITKVATAAASMRASPRRLPPSGMYT